MSLQIQLQSPDQQVASIAKELNSCLKLLDGMNLWDAAAHLSMAIEALPGQTADAPVDRQDVSS